MEFANPLHLSNPGNTPLTISSCLSVISDALKLIEMTKTLTFITPSALPVFADLSELKKTIYRLRSSLSVYAMQSKIPFNKNVINSSNDIMELVKTQLQGINNDMSAETWNEVVMKLYQHDFTLSYHCDQIQIICSDEYLVPSSVLPTTTSKAFWQTYFDGEWFVPWNTFWEKIKTSGWAAEHEQAVIKHFLDFCQDNVVSSYELSIFLRWFGDISISFKSLVSTLKAGLLVGAVPATEASTILAGKVPGSFLVRFSKTKPGSFAVSISTDKAATRHVLLHYRDPGRFALHSSSTVYNSIHSFVQSQDNKLLYPVVTKQLSQFISCLTAPGQQLRQSASSFFPSLDDHHLPVEINDPSLHLTKSASITIPSSNFIHASVEIHHGTSAPTHASPKGFGPTSPSGLPAGTFGFAKPSTNVLGFGPPNQPTSSSSPPAIRINPPAVPSGFQSNGPMGFGQTSSFAMQPPSAAVAGFGPHQSLQSRSGTNNMNIPTPAGFQGYQLNHNEVSKSSKGDNSDLQGYQRTAQLNQPRRATSASASLSSSGQIDLLETSMVLVPNHQLKSMESLNAPPPIPFNMPTESTLPPPATSSSIITRPDFRSIDVTNSQKFASSLLTRNQSRKLRDGNDPKPNHEDLFEGDFAASLDICVICMDRERSTVFLECCHMLCCTDCGKLVQICPICRSTISRVIPVFRS